MLLKLRNAIRSNPLAIPQCTRITYEADLPRGQIAEYEACPELFERDFYIEYFTKGELSTEQNSHVLHNQSGNNARQGSINTAQKKFITEAIRHPEKTLGDASAAVSPEYLFSESKGRGRNAREDAGNSRYIPLSRLSLEVKEAVASDPMYGEMSWANNITMFRLISCLDST